VSSRFRLLIFRASGVLLVGLGGLHLAVTPFISRMVRMAAFPEAVDWLAPPMLLNHLIVGLLLLPLGSVILYAARDAASGIRWALAVTRIIAVAVAALPVTLFATMGTRYFVAIPFLVAAVTVCAASALLLVAAFASAPRTA
jgi:hypothetical protein